MATNAQNQLYPLATEKGDPIPLEVIRPLGVFVLTLPPTGAAFVLPAYYEFISVVSTVDAIWTFTGDAITTDVDIEDALMLHEDMLLTAMLPEDSTHFIAPLGSAGGIVKIQAMQRWAGIGLERQLVRR